MSAPSVSIVMIVQNEAERLAALLPELAWADEVVVLDGRSTDATLDVARQAGARVATHPFDNFAAQRNRALAMARGEWVLSIDADERPTPALAKEVARLIAAPRYEAYRVPIRSRIFGRTLRFSGTQDDRPVRLVRRGMARWVGDVHERLVAPGPAGQLSGWLEHETLPDVPAFLAKMHRYTSLAVARRLREGRAPRFGETAWAPAWEVFRRGVLKLGICDGPAGWQFCALSGLSAWVEANEIKKRWPAATKPVLERRPLSAPRQFPAAAAVCEVCA